jgi:hypothetical protein
VPRRDRDRPEFPFSALFFSAVINLAVPEERVARPVF